MDKIHYYVETNEKIVKCLLKKSNSMDMIIPLKEDGTLENYSRSFDAKNLFDNKQDAAARLEYLDKLYNQTFKYKPFLKEEILVEHLDKLIHIQNEINKKLEEFPNFTGVDFCDVAAGGIQIRGHHAEIKGYTYGNQITIKYDFSNYLDCIGQFVEMWKEHDVSEKVREYDRFLRDGEKWGWD